MKKIYYTILTIFLGGLLVSCDHKDLIYDDTGTPEIEIAFDWSKAPEAQPASVVAYLFPVTEEYAPLRYNFSGYLGGAANVPSGEFVGIGMNSDNTYWAHFRNTADHEQFEVYTNDLSTLTALGLETRAIPRSPENETERMAEAAADMMWTDRENGISIDPYKEGQVITFYPEEITCHYTVTINNIENIEYLKGASIDATLSGLSESYFPGQRKTSFTPVTMPVVLSQIKGKNSVEGRFINFGNSADPTRKNILTVYLVFDDHTGSYATYDVTDQVREAPDPHHVNIVVDGLKLPKPISSGSGFMPNVNEWNSVDYTLEM